MDLIFPKQGESQTVPSENVDFYREKDKVCCLNRFSTGVHIAYPILPLTIAEIFRETVRSFDCVFVYLYADIELVVIYFVPVESRSRAIATFIKCCARTEKHMLSL